MKKIIEMWSVIMVAIALGGLSMNAGAEEADHFLWLEEVEGERSLAWVREQNAATEAELSQDPRFDTFQAEALELLQANDRVPSVSIRGRTVYNFWQDENHIRGVWRKSSLRSFAKGKPKWKVLLDVDALAAAENENWVYKNIQCSGGWWARCMVQLSRGGSDASVYREFNPASGEFVEDGFQLKEAKSFVRWAGRNTLLIGTDFGPGSLTQSGYARIVKRWLRGTELSDAETLFEGESTDVAVSARVYAAGSRSAVVVDRSVSFFESEYHVEWGEEGFRKLDLPLSANLHGVFRGQMIFRVDSDWKRHEGELIVAGSVLSFDFKNYLKTGEMGELKTLFAPGNGVFLERGGVDISKDTVYLQMLENVSGLVRAYRFKKGSWSYETVPLPEKGTISMVRASSSSRYGVAVYESMTTPDQLYLLSRKGKKADMVASQAHKFDASSLIVEQFCAASKDGTRVSYFVLRRKDLVMDGKAPTALYGYGGFKISETPTYSSVRGKLWAERGGVFVIANIRGGGEFGPNWHAAALKENRQRAYDDFAAVAEDLISRKITSPEKLGIMGGSNGGLLVGVAFTQRPDLYNAVVCEVPLLDMMRFHKLLAGASWVGEYGNPDIPEERAYIAAYSPYQNLKKGKKYPKVLFYTSTKDDRVHPGHARKMAAKMASQGHPFYFYENLEGGHARGANLDQQAKRYALEFTYLARQLGL